MISKREERTNNDLAIEIEFLKDALSRTKSAEAVAALRETWDTARLEIAGSLYALGACREDLKKISGPDWDAVIDGISSASDNMDEAFTLAALSQAPIVSAAGCLCGIHSDCAEGARQGCTLCAAAPARLATPAPSPEAGPCDEQWDDEVGECTHGLIGNYSTCNDSPKGCVDRERFKHCCYHLKKEWADRRDCKEKNFLGNHPIICPKCAPKGQEGK